MNLAMAVGGGALLFLGLVVSALWWMPLLMRGAGALVSACGPSAKIAAANVQKNPRRVAATGAALLVGVTLVTAISTGAASAKQTLADTLSHNYAVDVQVSGASLNEAALGKVRKVEGVKSAALLRTAAASMSIQGKKDSIEVGMVGITTAQRKSLVRADVSTPATAGIVVMNKTLPSGKANPYKNGDTVTFTAEAAKSTRTVDLTVVLKDFMPVTQTQVTAFVEPNVVDSLAEHGVETTMDIWAQVGEGTSAIQLVSDVQDAVSTYPGATVSGPFAEREMWETSINVVMAVLIGLLAVSVIIALIGVANTLSLSVIERTRESATLRAIGMTKRQLRTSLGVEALIIAVVAGIVGLVLGVGFGWLGSTVILSTIGTVSFQIDWVMCAAVMVIAIAAALVSSIAPARRAVKTSPVVALAEA
jgi:putative ABC transport system permease protein